MHQNRHAKKATNVRANEANESICDDDGDDDDVCSYTAYSFVDWLCQHKQKQSKTCGIDIQKTRDSDFNLCMSFVLFIQWNGNAALYLHSMTLFCFSLSLFIAPRLLSSIDECTEIIINQPANTHVESCREKFCAMIFFSVLFRPRMQLQLWMQAGLSIVVVAVVVIRAYIKRNAI